MSAKIQNIGQNLHQRGLQMSPTTEFMLKNLEVNAVSRDALTYLTLQTRDSITESMPSRVINKLT